MSFGRAVTVALFTGLMMAACTGEPSPTESSPATAIPAVIETRGPTAGSPAMPTAKPAIEATTPAATVIAPPATPSPTPIAIATTPTRATPDATAPKEPPRPPEPVRRGLTLSPAEVDGLVDPGIRGALTDLLDSGGRDPGTLRVLLVEQVTWSDASLGCPAADMFYIQVLTPGIWLVAASQEKEFDYRIAGERWTLCQSASTAKPLSRQPIDGLWTSLAPVPTPRSEVAAAEVEGKIYVFGGFGAGARSNEEYDLATNQWRKRAPIPQGVDHAAAVALDGKVYLIGGFNGRFQPVDTAWSYNPITDIWTPLAQLPTPRGGLVAAAIEGKIYAIGGVGPGGDVGTTEVYDPSTDSWESRAAMPSPRDHLALSVVDGRIYVIGGRLGSYARNLADNEVYDPATDTWDVNERLPTPRSGIASGAVGGRIYVFGGESTTGTFDENERYDTATGDWALMRGLPTARHGHAAVVLGQRIYVLAGGPTPGGSQSSRNEVYIVLPREGS